MTDDLREGLSIEQAKARVLDFVPGDLESIQEDPRGGWLVRIVGIDRGATQVIEDQDLFYDHFCEISTDNEADDAADVVECILIGRTPQDDEPGVLLECEWRRRIGKDANAGSVDGRLAVVPASEWSRVLRDMEHQHAQRSMDAAVFDIHYAVAGLRNALSCAHEPLDIADVRKSAADLMRMLAELEEKDAVLASS